MSFSWSVLPRLLVFRGQRQQLVVILLFAVNFILTLFTLSNEFGGNQNSRDGQNKLVALANSPGADIYLLQDVNVQKWDSSGTGYALARRIQAKCMESTIAPYTTEKVKVYLPYKSSDNRTQFCAIWKAGTTFFKRLFMIENKTGSGKMTFNPYDISFTLRYVQRDKFIWNSEPSRRFMFARDPYSRLYSAYIDKYLAPNPLFWKQIGVSAIRTVRQGARKKSLRCGHDLEFSEYIRYVVLTLTNTTKGPKDGHSVPMTSWCRPCDVKYEFVGKMESFGSDSLELLHHMNLPYTEKIIREKGDELSADDAIRDTLNQAFDYTYRYHFINCITVKEALHRCWRKLQYRGLIGERELRLSDEEIETLTLPRAIEMARKARAMSTKEERRQLKNKSFKDMYSTVSMFDMKLLKHIYRDDFYLFEYEDTPADLFGES